MSALRPRVFTIPPSRPFLPTLIRALAEGCVVPGVGTSGDPLALANATIYLPTRRACRLARELFLEALGIEAAVLPRLVAIGDIDEDELIFAEADRAEALEFLPAIPPLERRLQLAHLILSWARSPDVQRAGNTPLVASRAAAAIGLADALARLIDDMITRKVDWDRLDTLTPDHHDPYWKLTLEFLKIARENWPAFLADNGVMEAAARRDALIAAEARRLAAVSGPVIAAGSTASMPATAALLSAIARLPAGAVVLPGLDQHTDETTWELIGGRDDHRAALSSITHPQFAMHGFLAGLGMRREEVQCLAPAVAPAREKLACEALQPAAATHRWSERAGAADVGAAMQGLALIEGANPEEEALAIAVALRETLESGGKTAALVTPDRALARRVRAALARWQVPVFDSGGEPLCDTPAGVLARLTAEAALGGLAPVTLLALLKHPLFRLAEGRSGPHRHAVSVLERALLRGPRPRPGTAGLAHALATLRSNKDSLHPSDPRRYLSDDDLNAAAALAAALASALAPLEQLSPDRSTLRELAGRHRDVLLAIGFGDPAATTDSDCDAVLEALEEVANSAAAGRLSISPDEYAEVFAHMLGERVVRRSASPGARVQIFGLLEARLQSVDRVVLAGLTEGTWPPQTRSGPWLSRPMRLELGLDLPERRIGLSAHDFAQALGASEVFLTRAMKVGGAPTVSSRFMQRLAAVCGESEWKAARDRGDRYIAWARSLDRPDGPPKAIDAPVPCPPLAVRPTSLSVTEIEHWLRDPYTIYAKHILKLRPLDAVDTPPGARDRGTAIHAAIEEFTKRFATALPVDPFAELIAIGREKFAPLADYPEAQAFWWPRFERIARWFVEWERQRRPDIAALHVELEGRIEVTNGERPFVLRGRADRIEQLADGSLRILDYKTGQIATSSQVGSGLAPQLTLKAAMLRKGGFQEIPPRGSVSGMGYVRIRGGEPAGQECDISWKDISPDAQADRALGKLRIVVERFQQETQAYCSMLHPMFRARYGDYDHLARVKEWSAGREDDENGGPA